MQSTLQRGLFFVFLFLFVCLFVYFSPKASVDCEFKYFTGETIEKTTQYIFLFKLRLADFVVTIIMPKRGDSNYDYQGKNFDINFLSDKATNCFHTTHIGQNTT